MLGAICGDVVGSKYERFNYKGMDFPLFSEGCRYTDDTVLTVAVADAIMNNLDYADTIREYGRAHPLAGYGGRFISWLDNPSMGPYNSWGNGSAMRVSPVGWLFDTLDEVLLEAEKTASVTHNHPEGIKGAQAIAAAVFMARNGGTKEQIRFYISTKFEYDLNRTIDEIRPVYEFDVSCKGSVPESVIAFLESTDYEDCIRRAISIGGDSDTIAAMAGSIAEAFYGGVPDEVFHGTMSIVSKIPKFTGVLTQFFNKVQKEKV